MPTVTVERTYLEQREPPADADAPALPHGVRIQEEGDCTVGTYRELYTNVGRDFHWRDRLAWTDDLLAEYLRSPGVRIWIMREVDQLAGYFELCRHSDGSVEIAYFGLYPSHHGRGLGRALLTTAVAEGWGWGANRLWVHTCTLDGPAALPNYLARGFVPFNHERYDAVLPDE